MDNIFTDEYFMKQALVEANKAFENNEVPVGAVIVANNQVIARAYNSVELLTDITAHAEILAITAASNFLGSKYLNDCSLYVTVEPCAMCAGAIAWAQLGKLIFGTHDEKKGYSLFMPSLLHPKTEVLCGIMQNDCSSLIKAFFKTKRD